MKFLKNVQVKFLKNVQVFMVTGEKVEKLNSTFRTNLLQISLISLFSICMLFYVFSNTFVIEKKQNLLQMDVQALNEYINEDKAELVYNYIQEHELKKYNELESINGIGLKTIQKLEKYTYIKGVD